MQNHVGAYDVKDAVGQKHPLTRYSVEPSSARAMSEHTYAEVITNVKCHQEATDAEDFTDVTKEFDVQSLEYHAF